MKKELPEFNRKEVDDANNHFKTKFLIIVLK